MGFLKGTSKPNDIAGSGNTICTGDLTCPVRCDIVLNDYHTGPHQAGIMSNARYADNGEATGALSYTATVVRYDLYKGKFDISYDKSKNIIKLSVRVKFDLYEINLKDSSGNIKNDASGVPTSIIYHSGRTDHNLPDGSGNTYVHVARTASAQTNTFLANLKSEVENILNTPQYYLVIDPCCAKLTPCEHKISIKFDITFGDAIASPHHTVNLFPRSERADAENWGEVKTNGDVYRTAAHETGHYLGWPDEYFRNWGAVHKMYINADKKVDQAMAEPADDWKREGGSSLMHYGKDIHPYYMCHAKDWFTSKTGKDWKVTT